MNLKLIVNIFIIIEMVLILNIKVVQETHQAGTVEVTGQIIEKIGPILATKFIEIK